MPDRNGYIDSATSFMQGATDRVVALVRELQETIDGLTRTVAHLGRERDKLESELLYVRGQMSRALVEARGGRRWYAVVSDDLDRACHGIFPTREAAREWADPVLDLDEHSVVACLVSIPCPDVADASGELDEPEGSGD